MTRKMYSLGQRNKIFPIGREGNSYAVGHFLSSKKIGVASYARSSEFPYPQTEDVEERPFYKESIRNGLSKS